VLHLRHRHQRILDAEVGHSGTLPSEVGDQWVVGVQRQLRSSGQRRHHRRPAVGDRLELAVSIELVSKQVAEQDRPGVELGADPVEPELIDLEQAQLAVDRGAGA
jgi:hypothetical protein